MANDKKNISDISRTLFWDTDYSNFDPEKQASYLVNKVLHFGTLDDFKIIVSYYGKPRLRKIIKELHFLDDKTFHFCSAYFNIPLTVFEHYKLKVSNLKQGNS